MDAMPKPIQKVGYVVLKVRDLENSCGIGSSGAGVRVWLIASR